MFVHQPTKIKVVFEIQLNIYIYPYLQYNAMVNRYLAIHPSHLHRHKKKLNLPPIQEKGREGTDFKKRTTKILVVYKQ
jgi:hypothetical protein